MYVVTTRYSSSSSTPINTYSTYLAVLHQLAAGRTCVLGTRSFGVIIDGHPDRIRSRVFYSTAARDNNSKQQLNYYNSSSSQTIKSFIYFCGRPIYETARANKGYVAFRRLGDTQAYSYY